MKITRINIVSLEWNSYSYWINNSFFDRSFSCIKSDDGIPSYTWIMKIDILERQKDRLVFLFPSIFMDYLQISINLIPNFDWLLDDWFTVNFHSSFFLLFSSIPSFLYRFLLEYCVNSLVFLLRKLFLNTFFVLLITFPWIRNNETCKTCSESS